MATAAPQEEVEEHELKTWLRTRTTSWRRSLSPGRLGRLMPGEDQGNQRSPRSPRNRRRQATSNLLREREAEGKSRQGNQRSPRSQRSPRRQATNNQLRDRKQEQIVALIRT